MKEYNLIANICIETTPEKVELILQDLTDATIEVVEKHESSMGGGYQMEEATLDDFDDDDSCRLICRN